MQYAMYVIVNYGTHAASEGHVLHYFLQSYIYIYAIVVTKGFLHLTLRNTATYIVLTFIRCRFDTFVR